MLISMPNETLLIFIREFLRIRTALHIIKGTPDGLEKAIALTKLNCGYTSLLVHCDDASTHVLQGTFHELDFRALLNDKRDLDHGVEAFEPFNEGDVTAAQGVGTVRIGEGADDAW